MTPIFRPAQSVLEDLVLTPWESFIKAVEIDEYINF